jgi:hypothetical protein
VVFFFLVIRVITGIVPSFREESGCRAKIGTILEINWRTINITNGLVRTIETGRRPTKICQRQVSSSDIRPSEDGTGKVCVTKNSRAKGSSKATCALKITPFEAASYALYIRKLGAFEQEIAEVKVVEGADGKVLEEGARPDVTYYASLSRFWWSFPHPGVTSQYMFDYCGPNILPELGVFMFDGRDLRGTSFHKGVKDKVWTYLDPCRIQEYILNLFDIQPIKQR